MRLNDILSDIKEEWVGSSKSRISDEYREIFINPSRSDWRDIKEQSDTENIGVRFIADKRNEKVFVVSGDVWHVDIVEKVDYLDRNSVMDTFWGIGEFLGSSVEINAFSDEYDGSIINRYVELCKNIVNGEYDWLERYGFDMFEIEIIAEEEIERYS